MASATATTSRHYDLRESRWIVAQAWCAGLIVYVVAIAFASPPAAVWINDLAWTCASLLGFLISMRTARRLGASDRKAWWRIALACGSWLLGQLHWNYIQLVLGIVMPYPNLGQIFYSSFAVFVIFGILHLPEARQGTLTLKHAGNGALVVCCLVAAGVLGLMEPVMRS